MDNNKTKDTIDINRQINYKPYGYGYGTICNINPITTTTTTATTTSSTSTTLITTITTTITLTTTIRKAVNGGWSSWSYGPCSQTCGGGTQTGTRSCNNPRPSGGGSKCPGSDIKTRKCNTHTCPMAVNGGWSSWSYGPCSQ